MKKERRKLVSEGNAYYELDMDCIERKKNQKNMERKLGEVVKTPQKKEE